MVATSVTRVCIDCGVRIARSRSRCAKCQRPVEAALQGRQFYRAAYSSAIYRSARRAVFRRSGGQCERILHSRRRCTAPCSEANHIKPLSSARDMIEALALCDASNLEAVCHEHNPRGVTR